MAGVTATTDPGARTGPAPGWTGPEVGPTALDRLRTWRPWAPPALVGGVVGLATAYTAWNDPTTGGAVFPACPLKELTGLDCPGCGGTRAVHALTHGDIETAFDHNAILTIVLPLLALAWGVWMIHAIRVTLARRRATGGPTWPAVLHAPRFSQRGWLGVIAVIVAFAVVRNVGAVPLLDYLSSDA